MLSNDIHQRLLAVIGQPAQKEKNDADEVNKFLSTFKSAITNYVKDVIFDEMQKIGSVCVKFTMHTPSFYENSMRLRMIEPLVPPGSTIITAKNYFAIEKWMMTNQETVNAMWREEIVKIIDDINDSILLLRHASLGGVRLIAKETTPGYFDIYVNND